MPGRQCVRASVKIGRLRLSGFGNPFLDRKSIRPGLLQRTVEKLINKLPMTTVGHSALEDELKHRIGTERPRLIQRIQEAIADDSNLAENSEYQAAKADQEINEGRIAELEDKLARAEVIDVSKLSGDTIKFGATVTSPIARALIGKTKDTTVEVEAPGGAKIYKVRKVEWLESGSSKRER